MSPNNELGPESELKASLNGLTSEEASTRLAKYGANSITSEEEQSKFSIFAHQFTNPMVYLLLGASGLSFFFQEWIDGGAILIVILVNALIGFWMELRAQNSMNALKELVTLPAKVRRNGRLVEIPSDLLVPGDLVFIEAGDVVAADARLFLQWFHVTAIEFYILVIRLSFWHCCHEPFKLICLPM